jgi:hypothetical protein
VKLLGFFVVEPAILFFDEKFLNVYFPDHRDFHSCAIFESLQINPMLYFMNKIIDEKTGSITNFLLYQEDDYRFGITMIFSKETYPEIAKFKEIPNNFI